MEDMKEKVGSRTRGVPNHLFYVSTVVCTLRIAITQLNGCDNVRGFLFFLFLFFF